MDHNLSGGPEVAALQPLFSGIANLPIEFDREDDGRVIAEIEDLPGCLVYGASREEATRRIQALALQIIADMLEHGELVLNEPMAGR